MECVYVNIFFLMTIDTFHLFVRFYHYIFAYGEKKCLYPFTINDYEIPMHIVGHCKCLEECTNYFFHAILYWVTRTMVVEEPLIRILRDKQRAPSIIFVYLFMKIELGSEVHLRKYLLVFYTGLVETQKLSPSQVFIMSVLWCYNPKELAIQKRLN